MKIKDEDILKGDLRSLAKAITLVESSKKEHQNLASSLLSNLLKKSTNTLRIGISGAPGVGKSTFIETLGLKLIKQGYKVAVLAVDPSSPLNGGSILGDKTRMEELSKNPKAFIRPSPTGGTLGGVALKTRESLLFCEAAGFDIILVETVGVGQSEYEVESLVDFFMVLLQPGAGDELQGIKRGILELADLIVINKADGDSKNLAMKSLNHYKEALKMIRPKGKWVPLALALSSLNKSGFDQLQKAINSFWTETKETGELQKKRNTQKLKWFEKSLYQELLNFIEDNPRTQNALKVAKKEVLKDQLTPYQAVKKIINFIDS